MLRAQSSTRFSSLQVLAVNLGVPRLSALLTSWLQIWGIPLTPSDLLGVLTELRKVLYLQLQFYCEGHKLGPAKWDTQGEEVWKYLQQGASAPSPHGIRTHHPPCTYLFPNQEANLRLQCPVFIGYSLCRYDWLNHWPYDSAVSSLLYLEGISASKFQTSNQMVGFPRWCLWTFSQSPSWVTLFALIQERPTIRKTLLTGEIPRL